MNEKDNELQLDQLLAIAPGGIAKLAFDDVLTILYATDTFYSMVRNVAGKSKYPTALMKNVYSADIIYVTQQLAAQKHRKDNMFSINFRTLRHGGSLKWVMINGTRVDEVYPSGNRSVPVYSCVAMDVTDMMQNYKELEQKNNYHRIISELSKELYFEYEIAKDTLTFTELFREVFGKDPVMPDFRSRLEKRKQLHPEEFPAIIDIFNTMMGGKKQVRFEFGLFPKAGGQNKYICYASIIFDENKNPCKVVGKLALTDPMKKRK